MTGTTNRILLFDPDEPRCAARSAALTVPSRAVRAFSGVEDAEAALRDPFDLIILDATEDEGDVLRLLGAASIHSPDARAILILPASAPRDADLLHRDRIKILRAPARPEAVANYAALQLEGLARDRRRSAAAVEAATHPIRSRILLPLARSIRRMREAFVFHAIAAGFVGAVFVVQFTERAVDPVVSLLPAYTNDASAPLTMDSIQELYLDVRTTLDDWKARDLGPRRR